MQILGTFLIALLGKVFEFFVAFLGKRLALVVSVIAFLSGLAVTFFAAMFALISTVQYSISSYWVVFAISVLWPVHCTICISVIFSAEITRWVYDRSTFYVGLFWESASR